MMERLPEFEGVFDLRQGNLSIKCLGHCIWIDIKVWGVEMIKTDFVSNLIVHLS